MLAVINDYLIHFHKIFQVLQKQNLAQHVRIVQRKPIKQCQRSNKEAVRKVPAALRVLL